jgi:hypothetical protein
MMETGMKRSFVWSYQFAVLLAFISGMLVGGALIGSAGLGKFALSMLIPGAMLLWNAIYHVKVVRLRNEAEALHVKSAEGLRRMGLTPDRGQHDARR